MTNTPLPEQAQSPNSNEEAPHDGETIAAVKELEAAKKRFNPTAKQIGLGAAVGIGSAAIVAGLLYWRGGKR